MSEVLARVTARTLDAPRGPDVLHRIRVPSAWLESGECVEFELPRNLSCAACAGGGCDLCERSGAITLRRRDELPELLQVTLPARALEGEGAPRSVVIRIPEQGGLPPAQGESLPRGLLLLRVEAAEMADPGVTLIPPAAPPERRASLSLHSLKPSVKQTRQLLFLLVIVVLVGLAILAFQRRRGLG
ncbi:MAG: hypothetical protein ABJB12_05665 [Pseudomonadota bacterium]